MADELGQSASVRYVIRQEPKLYFANERTFLHWLSTSTFMATIAMGLMNFADNIGFITGAILAPVSFIFMSYAIFLFRARVESMKVSEAKYVDGVFVLLTLTLIFLAIMIVNIAIQIRREIISGETEHQQ
eukprot:Clim_evm32s44 gene=Clim_evmTU32s44